jgi:hypothetical protein
VGTPSGNQDQQVERAGAPDDPVVLTRRDLDDLLARVADLETREGSGPVSDGDGDRGRIGRRAAILGLAGAATAGIASLVTASPAAAANGQALVLGSVTNGATLPTGLTVTGTGKSYGIGVTDNGLASFEGSAAILAHAKDQAFQVGVFALAEGSAYGITAQSDTGSAIFGDSTGGTGVLGLTFSGAGYGGDFANAGAGGIAVHADGPTHLHLAPRGVEPPTSPDAGLAGMVRMSGSDAAATAWVCVAPGTPGSWRKLAGPNTAGGYHLLPAPVRVYDSRPGTSPSTGPKTPLPSGGAVRVLDLKVNSAVPAGALGAVVTVLLVNATTGSGNFTIWANGVARPASNTMVWGGSAGRFTTLAMTSLDALAKVQVSASLQTDLVLDVVGYYR